MILSYNRVMKIVITGGGTGGHFYPLIAVADKIYDRAEELRLLKPEIIYMADKPYNEKLLYRKGIRFQKISAGKMRRYFSLKNIPDFFKMVIGMINTFVIMLSTTPDAVFTNGSYVSVPVLFAAKVLRIPIFLHVSDAIPSRALLTAAKSARRISIAFPEAQEYLPKDDTKVAIIGNPIQDELLQPLSNGAHEFLELDYNIPTIFVIGGSSGAQIMNDTIIDALPKLLMKYNVIHQAGSNNFQDVAGRAKVVIYDHPYKTRYKLYPYLETLAMRMSAGASDIVVSRAGAGSISEIAQWGKPSIVIPIPENVSRDQEKNAFSYAKFGATVVIKQGNLSANILISEIERILGDQSVKEALIKGARSFAKPDAATRIANEIVELSLEHEK